MEPAGPTFEYLACPECGTRYLAREHRDTVAPKKARWFHCQRCNKRVQSLEVAGPEPVAIDAPPE